MVPDSTEYKNFPRGLLRNLLFRTLVFLVLTAAGASCNPITWTLSNVTFNDGGTLNGTFVFDADTGTVSNWNFTASSGSTLGAFTWNSSVSSGSYVAGGDVTCAGPCLEFSSFATFPDCCGTNVSRILDLGFLSALTDSGGVVTLNTNNSNNNAGHECINCAPFRLVTGGTVQARVTYDLIPVNVGGVTVTGTITTDGTIGPLSTANILAWNIDLAMSGFPDEILSSTTQTGDVTVQNNSVTVLTATPTELDWNFAGGVGAQFTFQPPGPPTTQFNVYTDRFDVDFNGVEYANYQNGQQAIAVASAPLPPSISSSFGANTIPLDGSTSLTFSISNPNTPAELAGVAFLDSLPVGLAVATPNGLTGTCGGGTITAAAGAAAVSLAGTTLAAGAGCTFSVNVTGFTSGQKNNSVTATSFNGGSGNTSNATVTVAGPPTITVLSPSSVAVASPAFTLTVIGNNYFSGSTISFNGNTLSTTFVNQNQVTATVPANLLSSTGTYNVTVTDPGGAVSSAATFSVSAPSISQLIPSQTTAGSPSFTITVTGNNFISGSTVFFGSIALATTFLDGQDLIATVPATLIASAGTAAVTVSNSGVTTSASNFTTYLPTGEVWTQLIQASPQRILPSDRQPRQAASSSQPAPRFGHSAVYDATAQQMIVFGGNDGVNERNDLWSLSTSGLQWTSVTTAATGNVPPARFYHTAVYDSANSRMMLFGGLPINGCGANDLWVLSNANGVGGTPTWTQLSPSSSPAARWGHNAVYDPKTNKMIIFGGNGCQGPLNDVWTLSNANGLGGTPAWTALSPTGTPPSPRAGSTMVYDPVSNELIISSGNGTNPAVSDLWILSNANGTGGTPVWTHPISNGQLEPRSYASAIYDPTSNRMAVFDGVDATGTFDLSTVWLLINANGVSATPAWQKVSPSGTPPQVRDSHTAIYDSVNNRMIIYGGESLTALGGGIAVQGDVWALSQANGLFPALGITTNSLPNGYQGAPYGPVNLIASGGSGVYTWSGGGLPGVTISNAGIVSGTPTASGTFSVTATVFDPNAGTNLSQTLTVTIAPPVSITTKSLPGGGAGAAYGPVTLTATGGSGSYVWSAFGAPTGVTMSAAGILSSSAVLAASTGGSYAISVTVRDSVTNLSATATFPVTIYPALSITTASLPNGYAGVIYKPVPVAATGGSGNYNFSVTGAPPGVAISGNALSSSSPLAAAAAGNYTVTLTVTDSSTNATASATFTITIAGALQITTTSLPNGSVGSIYGPVTMNASGGSAKYSWAASGTPPGVSMSTAGLLSSANNLLTSAAGSYSVLITLTDTVTNLSATQTYSVSIAFAQLTLSGSTNLGGFLVNAGVATSFSATGGEPPYVFTSQNLPAGLTLNTSTGALTGAIAQAGTFSFAVQVTDSQATPASTSLNVNVFAMAISTTLLPNAPVSTAYSQTLSETGGPQPCTWSIVTGSLPPGLSLGASTGTIGGAPTAPASGTIPATGIQSSFTAAVTCSGVTAMQALSVTVTPQVLPLQIPGGGTVTLTSGNAAILYSQNLQAANGVPPYKWAVIGGTVPSGLALSASGTLSGSPVQGGTYSFTAQVTDSQSTVVSSIFTVFIAPTPLHFTTTSPLSNGIVGTGYPLQVLSAAGGILPYTFALSGTVPSGLVFSNGLISGTPTTAGVTTLDVTVSDSSSPPLTSTGTFQISVTPAHADLILSQTSLSFALSLPVSTGAGLPSGSNITVQSSVVLQLLNYTVQVLPQVSWLDVSGGGTTPGAIGINLDPSALTLGAGTNQTSIVVTCVAPSPCAGNSQTIRVTLNVTTVPPQLIATSNLLSFTAQTSNEQAQSQSLGLQNTGGGTITVNSVTPADSFVTVSGVPSTIAAGPPVFISVTVNPTGLTAAYYQSSVTISTSAGTITVPVTLLLSANATMTLNPAGTQFQIPQGGAPGNPNGSFLVSVTGNSTINWTATLVPGANWVTLNTASGSSTAATPGTVSYTINSNGASLTSQAYYATIRITSPNVVDSPQDYLIVLNVSPGVNVVQPNPQPAGLLFTASAPGTIPAQTVQVYASSTTALSYQAASDSPWLAVSPGVGSTSASSPAQSIVSVNYASLAPGVYRGNVSYAFSAAAVRTVNVTLIVEQSATGHVELTARPKASCAPSKLVPTQTGLVNNFSQPTSWPTPLTVLLVDDCGSPVNGAQVVTTFNNGDPPLALSASSSGGGTYAGTWTPRNSSSQLTIAAQAAAKGFPNASVQIVGQVTPNAAPILNKNGTLNVFAPMVGAAVAPGTIVQIYGSNLASQPTPASTIPLPSALNQTTVFIGGMQAPLYYVSAGQINAQVPFELPTGQTVQVIVNANGALSTPNPIQLQNDAPGIAQFPAGEIIAEHLNGSLVLESSPAQPGEYIVMFVAGMGLTNQNVASGTASPSTTLANVLDPPTLTLNGVPVTNILFAGLTPTLVGLYQIDFQVPANAPNGDLVLVLTQSTGLSDSTVLPVHN